MTFEILAENLKALGFSDVVLVAAQPGSRTALLVRHTVTPERAFTILEDASAMIADKITQPTSEKSRDEV